MEFDIYAFDANALTEQRMAIDTAMNILCPVEKQLIKMHYLEGYTKTELCRIMNRSYPTVTRRLKKALRLLTYSLYHMGLKDLNCLIGVGEVPKSPSERRAFADAKIREANKLSLERKAKYAARNRGKFTESRWERDQRNRLPDVPKPTPEEIAKARQAKLDAIVVEKKSYEEIMAAHRKDLALRKSVALARLRLKENVYG